MFYLEAKQQIQSISWKTPECHSLCDPSLCHYAKKCANVKWRENAKNLTEPYNGHFENLTEPYSKEIKTLQNLTQHLRQVVVTLVTPTQCAQSGKNYKMWDFGLKLLIKTSKGSAIKFWPFLVPNTKFGYWGVPKSPKRVKIVFWIFEYCSKFC